MEDQKVETYILPKAVVRIHPSDRTKDEINEIVRKAAEEFVRQVIFQRKEIVKNGK